MAFMRSGLGWLLLRARLSGERKLVRCAFACVLEMGGSVVRKVVATLAVFAVLGVGVLGVGSLAQEGDASFAPVPITSSSPCPATGCASGACHGFDDVPVPDGVHEMACPQASCSSVECHAWDTLRNRYHQASQASLNAWILMPAVLAVAFAWVIRKVR